MTLLQALGLARQGGGPGIARIPKTTAAELQYLAARADVKKLLAGLAAHAQVRHIARSVMQAGKRLGEAEALAAKAEFVKALAVAEAARQICADARQLAERYQDYAARRGGVLALIAAMRRINDDGVLDRAEAIAARVDVRVNAEPPDWTAVAEIDQARGELARGFTRWAVSEPSTRLVALQKSPAAAFMAGDLARLTGLRDQALAAANSFSWGKGILAGRTLHRLLETAEDVAPRRAAYDTQRAATVAALAPLRKRGVLAARVIALDKDLAAADALAERTAMHFEQGADSLRKVADRCTQMARFADAAEAFEREHGELGRQLGELRKKNFARAVAAVLDAVGARLVQAGDAARASAALDDPLPGTVAARTTLQQVRDDLAAARSTGEGLAPALALQAKAGDAKSEAAVRARVAELRKAAQTAGKAPDVPAAAALLETCAAALALAETELVAKRLAKATQALQGAAELLLKARGAQAEQMRHAALRDAVERRRAALLALPVAKAIAPRIDTIAAKLAEARQHDAAGAAGPALAALHAAEGAALAAEQAAQARPAYDTRVQALARARRELYESDGGPRHDKLMAQAAGQAEAFDFAAALRTLDQAEAALEARRVQTLAVLNPRNPALMTEVDRMIGLGDPKSLDELVKQLPDGVPDDLIEKIAKARFGITLEVTPGADATKSARHIYAMLAKVPRDVVRNPSLKRMRHESPAPGNKAVGGVYQADAELARTWGRPGQEKQKFGAALTNDKGRPQLPADVEPDCQPQGGEGVELLDWSALHEVGHSVDDANNFMGRLGPKDDYGAWIEYGANVEPIADAVTAWSGYGMTAEQKRYVLELIQGNKPVAPRPPAGAEAWGAAFDNVQRWYAAANTAEIWRDHAASMAMRIGERIYQQPYPDEWVSYKVVARKRGLTGFQFKAPGEWFAELYAGYHSGKLKPTHPSWGWLSKLSV